MQQSDLMIGKKQFKRQGHTYVMGILNVTPDSFSDGGSYPELSDALYRVEQMMKEGAELIDVGGESTRPGGYIQITDEEEIARTCPVIEAIKKNFDVPVSLDTYKSEVAKAGVQAGMDLFNDIWGLQYDPKMAKIIAQSGLPCVLMHNRKEKMGDEIKATPELETMFREDFGRILTIAEEAGIDREKIILDPGVGFAKSYEQNLWVINHLPFFQEMGYPVLLGTSRKSVVGLTLDLPVNERVEGTLATTAFAVECGCCMVRVHDVRENVRFIRMMEAIRNQK
jgi:dihydropteroate synthase